MLYIYILLLLFYCTKIKNIIERAQALNFVMKWANMASFMFQILWRDIEYNNVELFNLMRLLFLIS
jgi:hypothetical protein